MPTSPRFQLRVHPAALQPKPRGITATRYVRRAIWHFAPKLSALPECPDTPAGATHVQVRLPKAQRTVITQLADQFAVPPSTVIRWCLYSYAHAVASGEIDSGPVLEAPSTT